MYEASCVFCPEYEHLAVPCCVAVVELRFHTVWLYCCGDVSRGHRGQRGDVCVCVCVGV